MATGGGGGGGGGGSVLGLDASQYIAAMQSALQYTNNFATGVRAAALASVSFNEKGEQTSATAELMVSAYQKILVGLKQVAGGYEATSATVKTNLDKMVRDQEAAAARIAKAQADRNTNRRVDQYRAGVDKYNQKFIDSGATNTDLKNLSSLEQALEKLVASGKVGGKTALKILDDARNGIKTRLKGIQEDVRIITDGIVKETARVNQAVADRNNKVNSLAASKGVQTALAGILPGNNAAAKPSELRTIEQYRTQLQKIVQDGGADLTRFSQLVQQTMQGIAAPTTVAERQIVGAVGRILDTIKKGNDRGADLAAKAQNARDAAQLRQNLDSRFSIGHLSARGQDAVLAQYAKLSNLVGRGKISLPQLDNVFQAVNTGAKKAFTGAEDTAYRSLTRIQNIIQGKLSQPYEVNISLNRAFYAFRAAITANFALELLEKFKALTDGAAEFQRSIALIQTISQDANLSFQDWAQGIQKVSDELGKPLIEVASGAYDLLSNQVTKAADTFDVLRTAGQFARITNSSVTDSVNLLSSAINTYRLTSGDAERVAAQFFTTIDLGRVKASELADTMGRTLVFAQSLGVRLEEVNASIVTISQTGVKADTTLTLVNNIFQKLLTPTKELQELYDKLGVRTGELFVKTYGFVGALKILRDQTGGSSAKLAQYFNEIRGFQGVDNLISRLDVMEGAMKEFEHSTERAAEAKKKFDNLPGQQYLEETNKVSNMLTTGFKTLLMESVLGLSKTFGGLDTVVRNLISTIVLLTSTYATFALMSKGLQIAESFKTASAAAGAFNGYTLSCTAGITTATRATVAWGVALKSALLYSGIAVLVGVIAELTMKFAEARQAAIDFFETTKTENEKAAEEQAKTEANNLANSLDKVKKEYDQKRQALLQYLAFARRSLQSQADSQDKVAERLQEKLKNSLELVVQGAKSALQEIINQQNAALKVIDDIKKKDRRTAFDDRNANLFDFRKNALGVQGPGGLRAIGDEKKIYQDRIAYLNKLSKAAAEAGDKEAALQAAQEADSLTQELVTKKVTVNGREYFKYINGEEEINKRLRIRLQLLDIIQKKKQKEADDLESKRLAQEAKTKELEDAARGVHEFSLTKDGKRLYGSTAEAEKEFNARVERYRKAAEGHTGNNAFVTEDLLRKRREQVEKDIAAYGGALVGKGGRQSTEDKLTDNARQQDLVEDAFGEKAVERLKNLQEEINKTNTAYKKLAAGGGAYLATLGNNSRTQSTGYYIDELGVEHGQDIKTKRDKLLAEAQTAQNAGQLDVVREKILALKKLYEDAGLASSTMYGEGGETVTVAQHLTQALQNLGLQKEWLEQFNEASTALDRLTTGQNTATRFVQDLVTKFGSLGGASSAATAIVSNNVELMKKFMDDLRAKVEEVAKAMRSLPSYANAPIIGADGKPAQPQSRAMGGSITDYFPGGPKGSDTVPVWATPGEFIVKREMAKKYQKELQAMNHGYFASGGEIGSATNPIDGLGLYHSLGKELEQKLQQRLNDAGSNWSNPGFDPVYSISLGDSLVSGGFEGTPGTMPQYRALGGQVGALGSGLGKFATTLSALNGHGLGRSQSTNSSQTNVGDIHVTVNGGNSGKATVHEIANELNRAIRAGQIRLRG